MKRIVFYYDLEDDERELFICRYLSRMIHENILIVTDNLDELNRLIWSFDPTSFIPHCLVGDSLASKTGIWLSDKILNQSRENEILISMKANPINESWSDSEVIYLVEKSEPEEYRQLVKDYRDKKFRVDFLKVTERKGFEPSSELSP